MKGGLDAAARDNRPSTFLIAFEKHRHFGFDLVLTTPNIDKIRPDIRGCSEGAYKHKNQALIGIKGLYLEAFHLAEDSGKNANDFLSVRNRRISKYVWDLYKSTATGTFSDTIAGTPLWLNPRVLFFMAILAGLGVFLVSRPTPAIVSGKNPALSAPVDSKKTPSASGGSVPGTVGYVKAASLPVVVEEPLAGFSWRIAGVSVINHSITPYLELTNDSEVLRLSGKELAAYGYKFSFYDQCHLSISYGNHVFHVRCRSALPKDKSIESLIASN